MEIEKKAFAREWHMLVKWRSALNFSFLYFTSFKDTLSTFSTILKMSEKVYEVMFFDI